MRFDERILEKIYRLYLTYKKEIDENTLGDVLLINNIYVFDDIENINEKLDDILDVIEKNNIKEK